MSGIGARLRSDKIFAPAQSSLQSLWMLAASFIFAFMGVCVKLASNYYSVSEIVMYRGATGLVLLGLLTRLHGGTLYTPLPWHHLRRGVIGVTALWLWFYSMSLLPLATAMTLNYMSSIWLAAMLFGINWWQGRGRFAWGLAGAILLSFGGVTLLLQPSFQSNSLYPAMVALGSGMLSALAYLQVRNLGLLGEPEYRVVFYFSGVGFLGGLVGQLAVSPLSWHAHTLKSGALLLAVGLCATAAQIAMTRAYRLGNPLISANLQYSGIVFSTIWGMLVWGDMLSWVSWTGILIILGSGMVTTFYNYRRSEQAAKETVVADV